MGGRHSGLGLSRPAQRSLVLARFLRLIAYKYIILLIKNTLMPEQPPSKLYLPRPARDLPPPLLPPVRYVELHCKTNFSFLEGASHPDELITTAVKLGYAGMAVTDRNSLAGAVRAHIAAKQAGIKLI